MTVYHITFHVIAGSLPLQNNGVCIVSITYNTGHQVFRCCFQICKTQCQYITFKQADGGFDYCWTFSLICTTFYCIIIIEKSILTVEQKKENKTRIHWYTKWLEQELIYLGSLITSTGLAGSMWLKKSSSPLSTLRSYLWATQIHLETKIHRLNTIVFTKGTQTKEAQWPSGIVHEFQTPRGIRLKS